MSLRCELIRAATAKPRVRNAAAGRHNNRRKATQKVVAAAFELIEQILVLVQELPHRRPRHLESVGAKKCESKGLVGSGGSMRRGSDAHGYYGAANP